MFLQTVADKCHANLLNSSSKLPLAYLVSRGVSFEEIKRYKIGYIGKVLPNINPKGEDKKEIENFNKWLGTNGKFVTHRIVFPILDEMGNIRGIETRGLDQRAMKVLKPVYKERFASLVDALPETSIRYKKFYFEKSKFMPVFFGLDSCLDEIWKTGTVFLTEGILDALPLKKIKENTLSSLTANLNDYQINWLRRYVKKVILLFDMDEKGKKSVIRLKKILGNDFAVHSIGLKGKDVNDFIVKYGDTELKKLIEDKMEFIF